ncbi:hypothetical protein WDW37_11135 [Bdellovibrionota bacterium FG-1]
MPQSFLNQKKRKEAEIALFEATAYLQKQLALSGSAIARILRLPSSTVNSWLKLKRIPLGSDAISNDAESLIHLIAIHRNLEAMLDTPNAQREWLKTSRPDLGFVPLQKIAESFQSLLSVRQYLDFARGRGA